MNGHCKQAWRQYLSKQSSQRKGTDTVSWLLACWQGVFTVPLYILVRVVCELCVVCRLAAEQSDVLSELGLTEPVDKLQVSGPRPQVV